MDMISNIQTNPRIQDSRVLIVRRNLARVIAKLRSFVLSVICVMVIFHIPALARQGQSDNEANKQICLGPDKVEATQDMTYGNYHIIWDGSFSSTQLQKAVREFSKKYEKTALFVHNSPKVPMDPDFLKSLGFEFWEYNFQNNELTWILDNGRKVAQIGTAITGAGIVVINPKGEILLILNPDINTWVLPSGGTDRGELVREGAIRELKEEVDLDADPDDLTLIMVTNRTNAMGRPGLNIINSFFLLEKYVGIAKASREAPQIAWVKPDTLKGQSTFRGKKIHPLADYLSKAIRLHVKGLKKDESYGFTPIRSQGQKVDIYIVR